MQKKHFFAKKTFLKLCATMLLFFVSFSYAFAASGAPTTLSFQGRLYDASGNLLGGAGTTYYFKFSLWDNPTVGSGSRLWPASAPTSFPSIVKSGVFNVNIGDTADGYPDALNYNFNTNSTIYLQIEVSSDNVTFQTLSPRQLITAAAFAQLAGAVSGVGQSSFGTTTPIANSVVSIVSTSTNSTALTIGGFFGQVADLFDVQNSTGNNLFSINANGSTTIANLTAGIVRSTASGQLYTDTNSYLTSAEASSTYASTTWVASTFEPIALLKNDYVSTSTFSGTLASYLTSATAANIYLPLSASTSLAYIPFASSSLYYLASNPEGFISTTSIAADYVSTSTFSTTLNSYLSTTSASQIYLPLSASTSLAYVATETDPFFEAASSSLPYYIPAASSSLYLLNSASTSLAYIPFASSSLYYLNSNPSNYITATTSSLTNYVSTSSFANTLLGYLSTTSAAANYVSTSTITNYLTTATAASTYLPLSASTSLAYIPFASSTLYVPYSNATGGVNLNNKSLANVSTLSIGSTTAPTGGVAYFNGNVGIGATTVNYPLQVVATNSGTSTNVMELQNNSATTGSGVNLRFEDTSADGSLTNGLTYLNAVRQSDGSMNFEIYNAPGSNGTPNANLTIIGDTGDLGIGTTSPSQTLTVVGSGSQDIFNVASSSGISDLYVTSAGDVGVGTSTPVAIFDVNSGNNAIPSKFIESDVSRSTFFDSQIPTNNFVFDDISNAAGSQLRFRSKPFADLGQNNGVTQNILNLEGDTGYVGIGTTNPQQTLDMVAGGTYGYNGTQVIIASTTAFDYFFGDAGNLSTTGVSNTAIGHDALIAVGIGGYNTAIGDITLASDASGSNNTGIGRAALEVDSSGGGNTAVGRSALYYNTTTNNNTALGYQAGEFASGSSSIENQISSNSLYLGYLTSPLVSGDTNEIVIGENTVGLGSNTTVIGSSTATTLTAIPAGVFDIGTTTASTTFYVAGSGLLATIGDGGTSNTTAGLEMGGGRALFGYNGTDNAVSIEGGNAKGIEFLVGGTSGTFPDGGTDAMTILGSGNIGYVGIGTSTPTSLLTVWGNLSVGTSTSPLLLVNSATGILTINSPLGSEGLTLETNGSARVSLSATTGSVLGSLSFGASQSIGWGASANFGNADVGLARYTAGVLQVTGNALNNFSTLIAGNLDVPISTPAIPTIASSTIGGTLSAGTYWFKVSASDGIGSTTPSAEVTTTTTGTTGSITLTIAAVTGAASYNIYFSTTTAGNELAYFSTTTTTFVFATTSGATNLPSGVPTVTNAYADKIASSSNSWFDGGDVGIGTSNPIDILNIAGTNNNGITLSGTNPTISMNSSNYLRIGNGLWYYYGNAGNTWQLYDSKGGAQRFVVAADTGNVLIPTGTLTVGSTTAQSALGFVYIQATSSSNTAPLLTVATSTGATYLTVLANGNVGIGTSNPQNALTLTSGDTFVTSMATPATPAIASSTTGGNLTSGTYWFKVSASDGIGTTTPSAEVTTTTTGTTGSITLTIAAVTGAASYNIYFSTTTAGNELAYFSTTTTTFVFATTSGATNGTVPTVTNAYINKISASGTSWLDGGAVAINENPTNIPAGFGLTIGGGPTGVNPTIYFGNSSNWQRYATFEMYNSNFAMYNTQTSVYQFLDTPTGLMGLNTSTPTSILYVQASSTTNTSPLFTVASSSSAVFTVLASGNTGIGTTSPAYALTVAASSTGQIQMIDTAGAAGDYWYIGDAASNTFDVFDQGNAGVYMTNGGTSWTSASDERLKTNITTLGTSTLDEVLALNPVTYNWIATSSSQAEQVGFIAQQVAAAGLTDVVVMPSNPNDCVPGDVNQSDCYGLDYDRFAPYLVKAIQVQQGFIGTIETFINNLANGIAHLADIFVEQLTVGTQAAPSSSGITMYDHATGQPYCVFINNGVWTNSAGACGTATSTSDITDTASVGSAGGDSSSESSASSSDATMTDDTFATSTASTTDETVATSTATSTPDIIATSTPEIIPDDSASSTDTTDTSGDLSTSTDASSTGQ